MFIQWNSKELSLLSIESSLVITAGFQPSIKQWVWITLVQNADGFHRDTEIVGFIIMTSNTTDTFSVYYCIQGSITDNNLVSIASASNQELCVLENVCLSYIIHACMHAHTRSCTQQPYFIIYLTDLVYDLCIETSLCFGHSQQYVLSLSLLMLVELIKQT